MGYRYGERKYSEGLYSRWPDWWRDKTCVQDDWEEKVCDPGPWVTLPAPPGVWAPPLLETPVWAPLQRGKGNWTRRG